MPGAMAGGCVQGVRAGGATAGAVPHPSSVALLLADARLPGGGHAHSAGLEPALMGGMPVADVPAYLVGRATTVCLVEAGTAVVVARMWARDGSAAAATEPSTGGPAAGVVDDLCRVVGEWAARTPSPALREAARLLGRGYLRLAGAIWGDHPAVHAVQSADAALRDRAGQCARRPGSATGSASGPPVRPAEVGVPRPVVLGAIAAAAGLSPEDLVRLTVYDDVQAASSALLKLEPLDPLVCTGWVMQACAAAEEHVPRVAACRTPQDIPSCGAPQNEGWAQTHALTTQRLFRA